MPRIALILGSNTQGTLPLSDRAATGMALRTLKGESHACVLRRDDEALRYALAAGALSATQVDDLDAITFDIALLGAGSCSPWGDLLPAMLAKRHGGAVVLDVLDVSQDAEGLRVTRDLGRGAGEVLRVRGKAVLVMSEQAAQVMYVSRYRRQMALEPSPSGRGQGEGTAGLAGASSSIRTGKQTSKSPHPNPLPKGEGVSTTGWEPAKPRVKTGSIAAKTGGAATDRMNALIGAAVVADPGAGEREIIQADAATCAKHLLRYLRHHGVIAGAALEPSPFGRGQGEGIPGRVGLVKTEDPENLNVPSPQPSPKGRGGQSPRLLRGPRPLTGPARNLSRRPRPFTPYLTPPPSGKLARSPRPVGQSKSQRLRGPFPL